MTGTPDGSPESGLTEEAARLADAIKLAMRPHGGKRDSLLHNGSTMAAMAATTAATVLPAGYSTWARVAAGLATFLIAIARALDFGARWRWHLSMRSRYEILLDRVSQARLIPVEGRAAALNQVYEELFEVRALEQGIPGVGALGFPPAANP